VRLRVNEQCALKMDCKLIVGTLQDRALGVKWWLPLFICHFWSAAGSESAEAGGARNIDFLKLCIFEMLALRLTVKFGKMRSALNPGLLFFLMEKFGKNPPKTFDAILGYPLLNRAFENRDFAMPCPAFDIFTSNAGSRVLRCKSQREIRLKRRS